MKSQRMSSNAAGIRRYIRQFSALSELSDTENLYHTATPEGAARAANLDTYLRLMTEEQPRILLIGEAPGYRGTRRTGVPFASEYMIDGLQAGAPFFAKKPGFGRVYQGIRPYREATSTAMWRTISRYERLPLLWAVFPHHPHQPGNTESNRTPTRREILEAEPLLRGFLRLFPGIQTIAVGKVAQTALGSIGLDVATVRHPSRGGAALFARQLAELDIED